MFLQADWQGGGGKITVGADNLDEELLFQGKEVVSKKGENF